MRPKRRNTEYTILVDVEFLQVGQALQHKPQAALPQQQAKFAAQVAAEHTPKTAPIFGRNTTKFFLFLKINNNHFPINSLAMIGGSFNRSHVN